MGGQQIIPALIKSTRTFLSFLTIRLVIGLVVSFLMGAAIGVSYAVNIINDSSRDSPKNCSPNVQGDNNVFGDCTYGADTEEIAGYFRDILAEVRGSENALLPNSQIDANQNAAGIAKDSAAIYETRRASHLVLVESRDMRSRPFKDFLRSTGEPLSSLVGKVVIADNALKIFYYRPAGPLKEVLCDEKRLCDGKALFVPDKLASSDGVIVEVVNCPSSDTPCFEYVEESLPPGSPFCLHGVLPYQPGVKPTRFATISKGETC